MENPKIIRAEQGYSNKGALLLLFLISPIIALIYTLKNFSNKNYHIVILLFAFLYGYTFITIEGADTERYFSYFETVSQFSWSDFLNQILNVYEPTSRFNDFYITVLMYFCSLFSLNFNFFLGLQSLIYFYLLLSIINIVLKNSRGLDYKRYIIFLIGCVFTYSFAGGIVSVRFPVSFLFFFLFALKYLFTNKPKYVLFAGISCFIHLSVIPMILGLILFYLLSYVNNFKLKLLIILIFVIALNSFNIFELSQEVDHEVINSKVEGYTNENFIERRENVTEKWNWYVQLRQYATYYYLIIALLLSRLKIFGLKTNNLVNNLFLFSVILLVISMFNETFLDSISNRYRLFFQFTGLVYLFFILSYNKITKFTKILKNIFVLILILNVLIGLRVDSYTFDIIRLSLSPIITILGFEGANIYYFI